MCGLRCQSFIVILLQQKLWSIVFTSLSLKCHNITCSLDWLIRICLVLANAWIQTQTLYNGENQFLKFHYIYILHTHTHQRFYQMPYQEFRLSSNIKPKFISKSILKFCLNKPSVLKLLNPKPKYPNPPPEPRNPRPQIDSCTQNPKP